MLIICCVSMLVCMKCDREICYDCMIWFLWDGGLSLIRLVWWLLVLVVLVCWYVGFVCVIMRRCDGVCCKVVLNNCEGVLYKVLLLG